VSKDGTYLKVEKEIEEAKRYVRMYYMKPKSRVLRRMAIEKAMIPYNRINSFIGGLFEIGY